MKVVGAPQFFKDHNLVAARLSIWNKKFSSALARIQDTTFQKISASDEGTLILSVYKPGDDRTSVLLSVKKNDAGIVRSEIKPRAQQKPNSIVQVARKYLVGRRISWAYASLSPVAVVLEFDGLAPGADLTPAEQEFAPDCLILDLESRPPKISIAKKYFKVPTRYSHVAEAFQPDQDFFESLCEWSLEYTHTKRRPCFDKPLLTYCILFEHPDKSLQTEKAKGQIQIEDKFEHLPHKAEGIQPEELTVMQALALIPTHVRRLCRTRLQFLERRLQRQRADMPEFVELEHLKKRAEALKTYLYLWPPQSHVWYVPPNIIEETGLPLMLNLRQGESPGNLLDSKFLEIEKLKRRQKELEVRIAESEKALNDFTLRVLEAGADLSTNVTIAPESALLLCQMLDVSWNSGAEKVRVEEAKREKRLPYRVYYATSGEFIRVAKSASDGDAMLKLMPSHHYWVHVMTGEGSHVWLEKPKKAKPSVQAIREASILAVHHSKQGRAQSADVYFATRGDVEKKKDLAPGKVIVRRSTNMLTRYTDEELQKILATYK